MSGSLPGTVVVIDAMPFRRARDVSFLAPWSKEENVDLISVTPNEIHSRLGENINCCLLIYDIGGMSAENHQILVEIQVLRTLFPAAALVIFSDDEGTDSIIAALNAGAQAYFGNSMPPDLALQALSFVLHGGTYFPPAAIMVAGGKTAPSGSGGRSASRETGADGDLEKLNRLPSPVIQPSSDQRQASIPYTRSVQVASSGHDHFGTSSGDLIERSAFKNEIKAALPLMTERQRAVLLCLCQGDPNKVIGRKLGMTETTVKVHVREIMRKLGVVNRTQVAIAAGRNGLVGNGDLLLADEDTPEGSD